MSGIKYITTMLVIATLLPLMQVEREDGAAQGQGKRHNFYMHNTQKPR